MRILSHPFRLGRNGSVVTAEQGSDTANTEQLAALILTRRGERPLAPEFGITDPVFAEISPVEVAAGIAAYGPPVRLVDVTVEPQSDTEVAVAVTFS